MAVRSSRSSKSEAGLSTAILNEIQGSRRKPTTRGRSRLCQCGVFFGSSNWPRLTVSGSAESKARTTKLRYVLVGAPQRRSVLITHSSCASIVEHSSGTGGTAAPRTRPPRCSSMRIIDTFEAHGEAVASTVRATHPCPGRGDQYVNGSFVVRALLSAEPLTVSLGQLLDPKKRTLAKPRSTCVSLVCGGEP